MTQLIQEDLRDHVLDFKLCFNEDNRLSPESLVALRDRLKYWSDRKEMRVMVLSSGSPGHFSNGLDPEQMSGLAEKEVREYVRLTLDSVGSLFLFPVPIVCVIAGHALAAGAVIAICADYRVMAEGKARIGFPESAIAMNFPAFASERLRDIVGERPMQDLLYSGALLKPPQALAIGLVDEVVSPDDLESAAQKRAKKIATLRPGSLRGIKDALRHKYSTQLEALKNFDVETLTRTVLTEDAQEGMLSLIEKRRPRFR